mmetsp:Transcript_22519/g.58833  ORF Transcript_22519/g.58833 Transcript_22519/m.58833 type:complete len:80 (-) Transcript_22519:65-304(-)
MQHQHQKQRWLRHAATDQRQAGNERGPPASLRMPSAAEHPLPEEHQFMLLTDACAEGLIHAALPVGAQLSVRHSAQLAV